MSWDRSSTLRFTDRGRGGQFRISAQDGSVVAFSVRPWFGQRVEAFTPDGSALCGARRRHPVSRSVILLAGDGARLGELTRQGPRCTVVLADGRRLQLSKRWFGQGWVLIDETGAEVLWSVRRAVSHWTREQLETGRHPPTDPSIGGYRFHVENTVATGPEDWLVTSDGSIDLAPGVAVVEAYKIFLRSDRRQK